MKGIYMFTNKVNGKKYIGQSIHLEQRYDQHLRNYKNPKDREYNNSFHRALRKYGEKNFDYIILIQNNNFTKDELNELEIYYIELMDSYKNGYNETLGGNYASDHFSKLTKEEIKQIQNLLLTTKLTFKEIGEKYNVSIGCISLINSGKTWNIYWNGSYPLREKDSNRARGERVNTSLSSDKEILLIRMEYVNLTLTELYEKYKHKYSFSGLKKIIYGVNHKHLPIYIKRKKQWILNGTCIDYPRLEE